MTILGQHAGSIVSVTRSGATYVARLQLNPLLSSTVTSGTVALVTETASPLIENSTEKDGVELVLPHQAQAPLKDESSIPGFNQHIEYWLHAEQGGVV